MLKNYAYAAAAGLLTTIAVVIANAGLALAVDFNLFTLMVFFVLPMGAIACGAASVYGFFYTSHKLHLKPSPWMLLVLLSLGAIAYFGIHFAEYSYMNVDGIIVRDRLSFGEYMQLVTGEQTLRAGRGRTEVNVSSRMGFWLSVIQFVGLVGGSAWVYPVLSRSRACLGCQKYLSAVGERHRYYKDRHEGAWFYDNIFEMPVDGPEFAEALSIGQEKPPSDPAGISISSRLYECVNCHRQLWEDKLSVWTGKEWSSQPKFDRAIQIDPDINVARFFKRRFLPFI